jgi:hypothetical protein
MDFREMGREGVEWKHVGQDRDQCRAAVNTNEFSGSIKCGKFD